jgi:hypothetical protein
MLPMTNYERVIGLRMDRMYLPDSVASFLTDFDSDSQVGFELLRSTTNPVPDVAIRPTTG